MAESKQANHGVPIPPAEDADDLAAFHERAAEPTLAFEDVVRDLNRRGEL